MPKLPILPSGEPHPTLSAAGIPLISAPRHPGAISWPLVELTEALSTQWPVDAHAPGYTDLIATERMPRLSVEAVADPKYRHVYLTTVWVDLDTEPHEPWSDQLQLDAAFRAVCELLPDHAVYSTRGGIRAVAPLMEPIPLKLAQSWLTAYHAAEAQRCANALANVGLRWDSSANQWTRHYRLPNVIRINIKDPGAVTNPPLTFHGKPTWLPTEGVMPRSRLVFAPISFDADLTIQQSAAITQPGYAPNFSEVKDWGAWVSSATQCGKYKALLIAGEPFGPPLVSKGTRNPTLKTVLNSLAVQLFKTDQKRPTAEDLYCIVYRSVLAEYERDPTAPTLEDAWRLACASSEVELLRRSTDESYLPPAEVAREPDELPELITHGDGTAYILDLGSRTYVGPFKGTDLYTELRDMTDLRLMRESGASLRPVGELLVSHAVRARTVELCYPGVDRGEQWDFSTRTLRVQTFPPPDVVAIEHPRVAEWLAHFGNDHLLDWLATCTELGHATASVYLEGRNDAGKGMIVSAIARMWRTGYVTFTEAMGKFNDGLLRSPVIFLDEGAEIDKATSSRFRSTVAEPHHRIEAKNMPIVSLYGHPRTIMAGNNSKLLEMMESHSNRDIKAITERVLHIDIKDSAAKYLSDLGGKRGTADWVTKAGGRPGKICEHIAFLRATRGEQILSHAWGRFLVAGRPSPYHTRLITSDKAYSLVLLAIVNAIVPISGVPGGAGIVLPGDRFAYVNPTILHDRWVSLIREDMRRPSLPELAASIAALSGEEPSPLPVNNRGYASHWPISLDLLEQAARDVGHPGVETLRRIVLNGITLVSEPSKGKLFTRA